VLAAPSRMSTLKPQRRTRISLGICWSVIGESTKASNSNLVLGCSAVPEMKARSRSECDLKLWKSQTGTGMLKDSDGRPVDVEYQFQMLGLSVHAVRGSVPEDCTTLAPRVVMAKLVVIKFLDIQPLRIERIWCYWHYT